MAKDEVTKCSLSHPIALSVSESKRLLEKVDRLESRLRENHFRRERQGKSDIERRIGAIIVNSAKKPWKWPLLPLQMYRAVKYHRQLSAGVSSRDPVARTAALLYDRSRHAGVQLSLDELEAEPAVEIDQQALLVKASEYAHLKGNPTLELAFAELALAKEESAEALARALSAHVDLGNVSQAHEALIALRRVGRSNADWKIKAVLKQWSRAPLDELYCLESLGEAVSPCLDYVPNRICYILHASLPFTSNGYATRSHAVATAMKDNDWDVVCLTRPGYPWDMRPDVGKETESIDVDGISYQFSSSNSNAKTNISDYMAESISTLESQLKHHKPALVVAASNYRVGLMSLIACRRLGIPIVYEVRGRWEVTRLSRDPDFIYSPAYKVQNHLEGLVAKEADAVWTLTSGLKQLLVEQGVNANKISMFPNGANSDQFIPRERDSELAARLCIPASVPVFGYIGSFVDYEGLDDLVDAAGLLRRAGQKFRLLLVGNESPSGESLGGLSQMLRDLSFANGLGDWLIMPGRVPHDEVSSYYSLVDIAPFPRKALPVCELVSPLKPLEAMAMKKIVLVTDVMALAEIVEFGACGIVVEKGSATALVEGMKSAIVELEQPTGLAERAKVLVEKKRNWKGMFAEHQNELNSLIDSRGMT